MNKLLILFLCFCVVSAASAGDTPADYESAQELSEAEVQDTLKQNEEAFQKVNGMSSEEFFKKLDEENALNAENGEKKTEVEIVRQVDKKIYVLPECNDEKLYTKTKEFIDSYFEKLNSKGTLYRRRHYFIVQDLDKFIKEDVVAYKTSNTPEVANAIANVEMNNGLNDENLRLCKSSSQNKYAKKLYLLISPKDDGYTVQVLNLLDRHQDKSSEISFFYKN